MQTVFDGDYLTLKVVFDSSNYGAVSCEIKIRNGLAMAVFSDNRLAKDMYWKEKELAIDDVYYNERASAIGTKYPGKTKEEIAKHLIKKFESHNIKVKEVKND